MRRRLRKRREAPRDAVRNQGRPGMSFAEVVGLVAFALAFGAVVVFAFDDGSAEHRTHREFVLPRVSRAVLPTDSAPPASRSRAEEEGRNAADLGSAREKLNPVQVAKSGVKFGVCGRVRRNCVVDGDTFWFQGEKIRIADIDTPEIHQPRCATEHRLGLAATYRLVELLNKGPFELRQAGRRGMDRYGRKLLLVVRGDSSLGDQLVSEGLAHRWAGRKLSWCD